MIEALIIIIFHILIARFWYVIGKKDAIEHAILSGGIEVKTEKYGVKFTRLYLVKLFMES